MIVEILKSGLEDKAEDISLTKKEKRKWDEYKKKIDKKIKGPV